MDSFLRESFPYTNVNIYLIAGTTKVKIEPGDFDLDFDKDIVPKMYFSFLGLKSDLKLFSLKIRNDDFEGVIGIVLPAKSDFKDLEIGKYFNGNGFDTVNHSNYSEFKVSQKGVNVNSYGGKLSFVIGKINLKNKLNVNLNRTRFRDETEISKTIEIFEAQLINSLFNEFLPTINIDDIKGKSVFTEWFLKNNWGYGQGSLTVERKKAVKSNFYFNLIDNKTSKHLTLAEIDTKYSYVFFPVLVKKNRKIPTSFEVFIKTPLFNESLYYDFFDQYLEYGNCTEELNGVYYTVMRKDFFGALKDANSKLNGFNTVYFPLSIINNVTTQVAN